MNVDDLIRISIQECFVISPSVQYFFAEFLMQTPSGKGLPDQIGPAPALLLMTTETSAFVMVSSSIASRIAA